MQQYKVTATERTLRILESIVASQTGLTASQISTSLHIPRSAVYLILNTLMKLGYIVQNGARKPFTPGPRLRFLSQPYPSGTAALITGFRAETGRFDPEETMALAILSGTETVVIAEKPSKHTVRCVVPTGKRTNAAEDPAGLILLAGMSYSALGQTLIPYNDALIAQLDQIRREKLIEYRQNDIVTFAVPICPDGYLPEAAILSCMPEYRWTVKQAQLQKDRLYETAALISHRLGAMTYQPYGQTSGKERESIPMSEDELTAFLKGPWTARLACVRPDGSPHVVPVWYEWHDGTFLILAWPDSYWSSLVTANPTIALMIDEPWPPMRRVMVRGEARPIQPNEINGGIIGISDRISSRYLGKARVTSPGLLSDLMNWSAFQIIPKQCIALKQSED